MPGNWGEGKGRLPGPNVFPAGSQANRWHRLNHHGRLGPPPIKKFLVGAVREPPLRGDFHGKACGYNKLLFEGDAVSGNLKNQQNDATLETQLAGTLSSQTMDRGSL